MARLVTGFEDTGFQLNQELASFFNAPLKYWFCSQQSYLYPVADSGVALGRQTMIFKAGKTAFRPNGAQHVSLGQVNPRMRMNAAPG